MPGAAIAQPPGGPPKPVATTSLPGPMDFNTSLTWRLVTDATFETAHPYGNHLAVWKEVTIPAGAAKMRLATSGTFELETNYDFLELWAWKAGAWVMLKRYTGTVGPSRTEEFVGQHFYLKLATDASTTKYGFKVSAEFRN